MILIDTSAWIDFFRGFSGLSESVATCIEENAATVCGPIVTELRRGFSSRGERTKVFPLIEACHYLESPDDLWIEAGDLGFHLRKKGHTVKTLDLLIATFALAYQVPILTADSDFRLIQKAGVGLALWS